MVKRYIESWAQCGKCVISVRGNLVGHAESGYSVLLDDCYTSHPIVFMPSTHVLMQASFQGVHTQNHNIYKISLVLQPYVMKHLMTSVLHVCFWFNQNHLFVCGKQFDAPKILTGQTMCELYVGTIKVNFLPKLYKSCVTHYNDK